MSAARLILRSRRVVTPEGIVAADVVIDGERIVGVETPNAALATVDDLGDRVLMAGMVDPHAHVNEPGRTGWEGFAHATRAAVAGGVTTLADMPLNSAPVTTGVSALAVKRAAAVGHCHVDIGFHAGLVPANAHRPEVLDALTSDGVLAWKAFLCDSGLAEFPPTTRADLEAAMPVLAARGARLMVHAELAPVPPPSVPGAGPAAASTGSPPTRLERYRDWEASRPPAWECRAIELLISLCRATRCAVHIVHLSAADALPLLRRARAEGLPLTVETCPHYLHFAAEEIPDRDPRFKCAPPIRGRANREALWGALADGTIDLVASDHSPCPPALKATPDGDLAAAWGGIASLQLTLPVVWSGARARGLDIERLVPWLCRRPAELLGLGHDRGSIAPGRLASLVAWDPEASFVVDPQHLLCRHPRTTPYAGERLHGVVERTWVRGHLAARSGAVGGGPRGRLVARHPDRRVEPTAGRGIQVESTRGTVADPGGRTLELLARTPSERRTLLARCCAAGAWIDAMLEGLQALASSRSGPDSGESADLLALAERCFDRLGHADWLEAFAGHPRIGDLESLRRRHADPEARMAAAEQSGVREASDRVLESLAAGNADYERRFGHVFLVCATGRSAVEMLDLLRKRLANDPGVELEVAASEQRKITRLRLEALAAGAGDGPR